MQRLKKLQANYSFQTKVERVVAIWAYARKKKLK